MNRTTHFPFFLLFLFILGCSGYLDIEPEQAISSNIALGNEQGVRTAVTGTYGLLSAMLWEAGDVVLNSELFADDSSLLWTGYVLDLIQILNKRLVLDNRPAKDFWIDSYGAIQQANAILAAINILEESAQDAVEAELRFIRGYLYFDLVNMYAQPWTAGEPDVNLGVPIVTAPAGGSQDNLEVARNSVEEVYHFIIEDLRFAKENLPMENGVFAHTHAASALLSRVYLMQEKTDLAEIEADRVISSDRYTLKDNYEEIFNQSSNSSEDIFAIQVTPQHGRNNISFLYTGELEGGAGFIGITDDHLHKYEPGDLRSELFYIDQQSGVRRTAKWWLRASSDGNITIFRLAEMYLTRAEGRYQRGDLTGAAEDLNILRNRAQLAPVDPESINLETILRERYSELVFEGHHYRDTKRTRGHFGEISFDEPRMIYPIPQREIEVNRNLVQNEGY